MSSGGYMPPGGYTPPTPQGGFVPPTPQGGFVPPTPQGGYVAQTPSQGSFVPPRATQGYTPPTPQGGYVASTPQGGFVPPTPSQGSFVPPRATQGYTPPTPSQRGYVAPTSSTSVYVPPGATQGYTPPTPQGGFVPPTPQGGYITSTPSQGSFTYATPQGGYSASTPQGSFTYAAPSSAGASLIRTGYIPPDQREGYIPSQDSSGFEFIEEKPKAKAKGKGKGAGRTTSTRNAKDEAVNYDVRYTDEDYSRDMENFHNTYYVSKRGKTSYAMMLFRVKQNQIKMMKLRGYNVGEEENIIDPTRTIYDFVSYFKHKRESKNPTENQQKGIFTFKQALSGVYEKEGEKPCHVIFAETVIDPKSKNVKKVTAKYFTTFQTESDRNDDFILIGDLPLDSKTSADFKDMNVQYFMYEELMTNVLDAILSPEYIIMNKGEIADLLSNNKNNIDNIHQLQQISYKDAVVKYLGLKIGDVLKIIRNNYQTETLVNTTIAYRLVSSVAFTMKPPKPKDVKKGKIDKDLEDEYGDEFTPDD